MDNLVDVTYKENDGSIITRRFGLVSEEELTPAQRVVFNIGYVVYQVESGLFVGIIPENIKKVEPVNA